MIDAGEHRASPRALTTRSEMEPEEATKIDPRWLEVNGVSLRYALEGRGERTVVLVHEWGGALESWDETLPAFHAHFRTLRYDQRGFGASEKPRAAFSIDDMVADLDGLVDALGMTAPFHLAGSALGAGIAIAYAARHPARVARLAIANPVTGPSAATRDAQEKRAAAIERDGMRPQVEASLRVSYPQALRGDRERYERWRARWLANDPYCFSAMSRMLAAMDLVPDLANIACPTLVLAATHDTNRPPPLVKSVADRIPGARYVEVESGHFMAVQTPAPYAQHVVAFFCGH
jgi:3-oxoadipate enol-lactonase